MHRRFDHKTIEEKWQKTWLESGIYETDSRDENKEKEYVLVELPYPSGNLHIGHWYAFGVPDIYVRYQRMTGKQVIYPMGFDAFGLPAENAAIKRDINPREWTESNIEYMKGQLQSMGNAFSWNQTASTIDPDYYRWTQWMFTKFFTENIAYRGEGKVNWCPTDNTVIANEQVLADDTCERCGDTIEKRVMPQWMLRITDYADALIDDLDALDWPEHIKDAQRTWIGRSEGAEIDFTLSTGDQVTVFTTRPDTLYGATYMVLAPEHDLVAQITTDAQKEAVAAYLEYTNSRSERERISEVKEVTGAFTGAYATNPISGEKLPVWIGEYVLKDYGTGAIMAVPSDDERDFNFAKKYDLTITQVVDQYEYPNSGKGDKEGKMINSEFLNGLSVKNAIKASITKMVEMGIGARKINYKLRDANFSRQRYWGEPFPIKYDADGVSHPLTSDQLPLELPMVSDFKPTTDGNSPLSKASEWVNRDGYKMETNTMPGYAGSSWYFLRYMDPNNPGQFASTEALNYWQDVDLYIGGTEHAVGHLLYSRFVHKFLFDKGLVPTKEPFKKLVNQGMIQGVIESLYLHKDSGEFCSKEQVKDDNDYAKINTHVDFVTDYSTSDSHLSAEGIRQFIDFRPDYKGAIFNGVNGVMKDSVVVGCAEEDFKFVTISEVGKMSKRYHNVVNPDDVVAKYGADCFRMYEMFLGPIEQSKPWDTNGIDGVFKFLRKFWGLFDEEQNGWLVTDTEATPQQMKVVHTCIKKLNDDIARFSFNTGVSAFMICVNELRKLNTTSKAALEPLVRLIAPFAPFVAEELWHKLGNASSVHHADYPIHEDKYLVEASKEYPICFNGKKKILLSIASGLSRDEVIEFVTSNPDVISLLDGTKPKKVIVVPGRMVNLVV